MKRGTLRVELLYVRDCPNHLPTLRIVKDVLRESGLPLDVIEIEIASARQAETYAFPGSPTVRVDGSDVESGLSGLTSFGVSCRSYVVNGKRQGIPDRDWIVKAIRSRQSEL